VQLAEAVMIDLDTLLAFDGSKCELQNVKFFRGSKDLITAEEFRKEIRSALMQRKLKSASLSTEAPKSKHPKFKIEDFVATL